MKTIIRRVRRLEDRLGPPVETEFSRCLRERIDAGRRRLAESCPQDGRMRNTVARERQDISGLGVEQILRSGRERARLSGRIEADNT
jgi:hypothetical protein